jgi:TM2 domain-containing membrane protein YozV
MNCANHSDITATAFCRECGKPMCQECQKPALGSIYCAEHLPAAARPASAVPPPFNTAPPPPSAPIPPFPEPPRASYSYTPPASPYTAPRPAVADPSVHPGLALILGFAPGVGAIYNGQYAKGLVHAVVFGLMISILNNTHNGGIEAMVGIMVGVWEIYQAFEAYHTARKRRYGQHVEEFSSLFDIRPTHGRFPVGAIVLIGLGFLLLLDTTDIISIDIFARYWPALLIGLGVYLLYARMHPIPPVETVHNTAADEGSARR